MLIFLAGLALLIFIATLIPYSQRESYFIRGFDFPRLQLAVISASITLPALFLIDYTSPIQDLILVLVTLTLLIQSWWIFPYTPFASCEVLEAEDSIPSNTISLMTANVLMTNDNYAGLLELIKQVNPDIIVTLETNQAWQDHLAELNERYPYTVQCPLENLYGMHLYSRLALEETQLRFLIEQDIPSIKSQIILPSGKKIQGFFVHPKPPSPTENPMSSERDAELVLIAREAATCTAPVIVTGDLNDVAWSPTTRLFRKISGLLDPRVGRGMFNTFHAKIPFLRWPLDHVFHSEHFTLKNIQVLPGYGSDHFAMNIELVCDGNHQEEQEGLDADREDHEWAQHKVEHPHDDGF